MDIYGKPKLLKAYRDKFQTYWIISDVVILIRSD
jgi:hypothetical protein